MGLLGQVAWLVVVVALYVQGAWMIGYGVASWGEGREA